MTVFHIYFESNTINNELKALNWLLLLVHR